MQFHARRDIIIFLLYSNAALVCRSVKVEVKMMVIGTHTRPHRTSRHAKAIKDNNMNVNERRVCIVISVLRVHVNAIKRAAFAYSLYCISVKSFLSICIICTLDFIHTIAHHEILTTGSSFIS